MVIFPLRLSHPYVRPVIPFWDTMGSFQRDSALWSSHLEYSVTMPLGRSTGADSVSTRSAGRSRFLCVGTLDSQRLPFVPESASYGYWQATGDFTGKIRGPDSPV